MNTLQSLFPKADDLLAMKPEDLAPILLKLAAQHYQSAGFWPESVTQDSPTKILGTGETGYPYYKKQAVDALISQTWNWLTRNGFIEPSPGINGQNGWRVFTEQGEAVVRGND